MHCFKFVVYSSNSLTIDKLLCPNFCWAYTHMKSKREQIEIAFLRTFFLKGWRVLFDTKISRHLNDIKLQTASLSSLLIVKNIVYHALLNLPYSFYSNHCFGSHMRYNLVFWRGISAGNFNQMCCY